ncbi:MAG: VTT domain-containing protein [Desulfuromonadaceae bacterium]|nr:VTT domain-containing protein [Desulfuromonadaceae bacterium]
MGCSPSLAEADPTPLESLLQRVASDCSDCGACVKDCAFLQHYGSPALLAQALLADPPGHETGVAFQCSLCGLCEVRCPATLPLVELFLAMRRHEVAQRPEILKRFSGLRAYENIGTSQRFTWHALPQHCDSVFFPGCALSGTRPQRVWQVYEELRQHHPQLGLVLDCCTKPSHDLGDQQRFDQRFDQLRDMLAKRSVQTVLTACPNCYEVFRRYAPHCATRSIYEELAMRLNEPIAPPSRQTAITVHDACVNRQARPVQQAVRTLLEQKGFSITEMINSRRTTLCCGEGGCVMATKPQWANSWRDKRAAQAAGLPVISYCAGCVEFLQPATHSVHLLDLYFDGPATLEQAPGRVPSLIRYKNRLALKKKARNQIPAVAPGARPMSETTAPRISRTQKLARLALLLALVSAIIALRGSGLLERLDPQQMRDTIANYGLLAPVIFILLYSLAPVFFMPGLPLTLLGGLLFGPVWGVVYALSGATLGASLAFLVARYLGRDWIRSKLVGERWQKLDEDVARQGWKMVAFTRLIPLFPFNLLNYAFGLTNIRFSHYAITSLVCMAPATIAFISLSSSLSDLIRGQVSKELIIGLALLGILALLPVLWKRRTRQNERC